MTSCRTRQSLDCPWKLWKKKLIFKQQSNIINYLEIRLLTVCFNILVGFSTDTFTQHRSQVLAIGLLRGVSLKNTLSPSRIRVKIRVEKLIILGLTRWILLNRAESIVHNIRYRRTQWNICVDVWWKLAADVETGFPRRCPKLTTVTSRALDRIQAFKSQFHIISRVFFFFYLIFFNFFFKW